MGNIFDLEHGSFVDGPGIRTTVFFKGCNLRCIWCHNPESQAPSPQLLVYGDKCTGCGKCRETCKNENCTLCGRCTVYCPAGARVLKGSERTVEDIMEEILRDKAFYENTGGGVTFSGGECMLQIDFLAELLEKCKAAGIHTAVDTAGHVPFSSFERILPYTDLFLYDVKCFDPVLHRTGTGTDNGRILENLGRLLCRNAPVRIRIPIIPGFNDTPAEMEKIRDFLWAHGKPEGVELLPYHAMGENKYRALGKEPQIFSVPPEEHMQRLRSIFM